MAGNKGNDPTSDGVETDDVVEESSDEEVSLDFDETVGDLSAQIKVDELVAKIEKSEENEVEHKREVRKRLEEAREQREAEKDVGATFNFNLDDEL